MQATQLQKTLAYSFPIWPTTTYMFLLKWRNENYLTISMRINSTETQKFDILWLIVWFQERGYAHCKMPLDFHPWFSSLIRFSQEGIVCSSEEKRWLTLVWRKKINIWLNMSGWKETDLPSLRVMSQYMHGYDNRLRTMHSASIDKTAWWFNVYILSGSPNTWHKQMTFPL